MVLAAKVGLQQDDNLEEKRGRYKTVEERYSGDVSDVF